MPQYISTRHQFHELTKIAAGACRAAVQQIIQRILALEKEAMLLPRKSWVSGGCMIKLIFHHRQQGWNYLS